MWSSYKSVIWKRDKQENFQSRNQEIEIYEQFYNLQFLTTFCNFQKFIFAAAQKKKKDGGSLE